MIIPEKFQTKISESVLNREKNPLVETVISFFSNSNGFLSNGGDFDEQFSSLQGISVEHRDARWLEAVLLINGAARQNAKMTHYQMGLLRSAYESIGAIDKFDAFFAIFEGLIYPYTLGSHGYIPRLDQCDRSPLMEGLENALRFIQSTGRPAFINSGTLLGAVRDGGFIPFDDDVDIAVLLHGDDEMSRARDWARLRVDLLDEGLLDCKNEKNTGTLATAKLKNVSGVVIDLFPGWIHESRAYIWPHTFGELPETDVLPLKKININGVFLPSPAEPEKMLCVNYGPNWGTPDPSWRFPWKRARKKFRKFRMACEATGRIV